MSEEGSDRKDNDMIWEAFLEYDYERDGHISVNDLKKALEHAGEKVNEDWCYLMISKADPENKGFIQFNQFKDLIEEKRDNEQGTSEEDLLDAFVAMGGEPDGDGAINAEKLIQTIKHEFEMTIDIEKLIEEIDEDGSGQIEFDEFTALLTSGAGGDDEDEDDGEEEQ
jgi:Ca2+-binding EF-hand superfamily protein